MNTLEEHLNILEEYTLKSLNTLKHTLDHNGSFAHRLWSLSCRETINLLIKSQKGGYFYQITTHQ